MPLVIWVWILRGGVGTSLVLLLCVLCLPPSGQWRPRPSLPPFRPTLRLPWGRPLANPGQQRPGGAGAAVNHCDRRLSYLTSRSQTSSLLFIFVADLLDTRLSAHLALQTVSSPAL